MAALLKKHCGYEVELLKSTGGVFEVEVDGELIFSKKETGEFPVDQELIKKCQVLGER